MQRCKAQMRILSKSPVAMTATADASSVCPAVVHARLITFEGGGTVTIEIRHHSIARLPSGQPRRSLTRQRCSAYPYRSERTFERQDQTRLDS